MLRFSDRLTIKISILFLPFILSSCGPKEESNAQAQAAPAVEVSVVTIQAKPQMLTTELPGRAVAYRKAELRPQVGGIIKKRLFTEGARVKQGQELYQIDDSRYEANLRNAKAQLAKANANLELAVSKEERFKGLLKRKAVSQQDYDDANTSMQLAKAEVAVAEAAVNTAEINLRYTRLHAPIDGQIGKSDFTEGALVSAEQSAPLATIHQLDPIFVDVAQSAKNVLGLRKKLLNGTLAAQESAKVNLILEDGSVYEHQGTLQFSDMSVSESTGTVVLRALFPNPDYLLLPGTFVRAEVEEGMLDNAVLVPQRAVTRDKSGKASVLVVDEESKAQLRSITVSRTIGQDWLVEQGLSSGDRVVIAGLQKVSPGALVNAVEQIQAQIANKE